MERIINKNNISKFTVTIEQINNKKTLLPHVLYKKMETFVLKSVNPFEQIIITKPTLKKLNILKNAYLNDRLQLNSVIKKLSNTELQIIVEVIKSGSYNDVVCNAVFSSIIKKNNTKKYFKT